MERVFVSYHFSEPQRPLVDIVSQVLSSFGIGFETGVDLGGREVTAEIDKKIDRADGLIALMTRDVAQEKLFRPSDYVMYEYQRARGRKIPTVAIVEPQVDPPAWDASFERIDYDPGAPVRGLMKIVRTVGKWNSDAGRRLHVKLEPDEIFDSFTDDATCEFRVREYDKVGEWQKGSLDPQPGIWYAYVWVPMNNRFQIRVGCNGRRWISGYSTEDSAVKLKVAP